MSGRTSSGSEIVAALTFNLATIPVAGLAVSRLWGWFVGPEFKLPGISTAEGFGISLLVAVLAYQYNGQGDDGRMVERAAYDFMLPIVMLLIGWGAHAWWLS